MRIGVVGGDGKKTVDIFEQLETSGLGQVVWHIPAREKPSRLQNMTADIFICLLDYCGHQLNECTKARALELGAMYRTLSISKSVNVKKLEELMHHVTQQVLDAKTVLNSTGKDYISRKEAIALGMSTGWFDTFKSRYPHKAVPFFSKPGAVPSQNAMEFFERKDIIQFLGKRGVHISPPVQAPAVQWKEPEPRVEEVKPEIGKEVEVDAAPRVVIPSLATAVIDWIKSPVLLQQLGNGFIHVASLEAGTENDVIAGAELAIEAHLNQTHTQEGAYIVGQILLGLKARQKLEIVRS